MRRSGFVTPAICSLLTLASVTGWSAPTDAHDIYMALKNRFGQSCCNEGDCRPAHYRTTADGVQMLVEGEWLAVPDEATQYRALEGDTGETRGGQWCGVMAFGNLTYCAILPPTFGMKLGGAVKLKHRSHAVFRGSTENYLSASLSGTQPNASFRTVGQLGLA